MAAKVSAITRSSSATSIRLIELATALLNRYQYTIVVLFRELLNNAKHDFRAAAELQRL
jgi:hypothetical protein